MTYVLLHFASRDLKSFIVEMVTKKEKKLSVKTDNAEEASPEKEASTESEGEEYYSGEDEDVSIPESKF